MIEAFEENKKGDEDIKELVKKIMSDVSRRKCGNKLFDHIEECFLIPNSHFTSEDGKVIDTSQILSNLQKEILNILPIKTIEIKPFLVGMTGYNL